MKDMMRKCGLPVVLFLIATCGWSKPLPVKTTQTIIIDTDCAIDDMRAISILLCRPEIVIKGILLSDGSLPPDVGYSKIQALLHAYNRDTIPVGCGKATEGLNPAWRDFNFQINWGELPAEQAQMADAGKLFAEITDRSDVRITMMCLGPLTNLAGIIQSDSLVLKKIDRILWYNEPDKPMQGFNYECDKLAADAVLNSGLKIILISNLHKTDMLFDTALYQLCLNSKTSLAVLLARIHSQPAVLTRLNEGHFRLCDELVALYLLNPELFDINTRPDNIRQRYNQEYNADAVREVIGDMIIGSYALGNNVVFNKFPDSRELFSYDVRQIMDSAISWYGHEEWKANVMTDEFHGHLGVFSIVGAKMGIRARELFGAGPDELEVVTYAGVKPPYSCLNDGIQVSTGATLGMGTIHLAPDSTPRPSVIFTHHGRSFQLTLKPEYLSRVDADIKEGIIKFGLLDDGYWKLIRRNALRYWLEWDRNEIFTIEELLKP